MTSYDALVAGGGVAGLSCAAALADAGLRVLVLEARAQAGGRARSWPDARLGVEVDLGAHVVSSEHRHFLRLLERVGTADQVAWQRDTLIDLLDAGERLKVRNVRWPPPLHGLANARVALRRLSLADALSHARVVWRAARENEQTLRRLDAHDALSWLRGEGVSERGIAWFWRSALLALLNVPLEQCSMAAAMRVFRLMLGRSGYHFGFPAVALSRLYVPGCTAAIRARGGDVRVGAVVRSLDIDAGQVRGVQLRDGTRFAAPVCVVALAPWDLAALLARTGEGALAGLAAGARVFRGAPYVSSFLWLDRRVTGDRFWSRVWNPKDLNTDFYDLANIRPEFAGGGSVIASNAIGPHARPHWNDEAIVARTLAELREYAPEARGARVLHARVHRIRAAIPQPRPGTETLRPATRTPLAGLFLAGDWIDTSIPCSMESAARAASLAVDAILGTSQTLPAPQTYGLVGLVRQGFAQARLS